MMQLPYTDKSSYLCRIRGKYTYVTTTLIVALLHCLVYQDLCMFFILLSVTLFTSSSEPM